MVGDITEHSIMDPHTKLIDLGHLANNTAGAEKVRKKRKLPRTTGYCIDFNRE